MFCKQCGKEIANDSLFCQHCGTPQNGKTKTNEILLKDRISKKMGEKWSSFSHLKKVFSKNWKIGFGIWVSINIIFILVQSASGSYSHYWTSIYNDGEFWPFQTAELNSYGILEFIIYSIFIVVFYVVYRYIKANKDRFKINF